MVATLIWENRRIIGEIIGLAVLIFVAWWFFVHNPKVIADLEKDKAELARQVQEAAKAQVLLNDITQGKAQINENVFKQISSIRAATLPRRTVLIVGGVPLPSGVLKAIPAH